MTILSVVKSEAKKGHALTTRELSRAAKVPEKAALAELAELRRDGSVKRVGIHWVLVEHLPRVEGARPKKTGLVPFGRLIAIEYETDKYDGKMKVYRHKFRGRISLWVSPDGKTLKISPNMKVTKRGMEG